VGIWLGDTALEIAGLYLIPREVRSASGTTAQLQLPAAVAGVCRRLLRVPALAPCLHVEVGRLSAQAQGSGAVDHSVLWLMPVLGLRLGFELAHGWHWQTELAAGTPWDRARFASHSGGTLYSVPEVVGRASTGLEAQF
jgi:uncharacterized membrane protein YadS